MSANRIIANLTQKGFDVHGRCRGKSSACFIFASKRGNWDYGDKECRLFIGIRLENPNAESISFKFSISRSALATDDIIKVLLPISCS